ncbi:MCE family protein [Nocardioides sp. W3-2-3]|uniref:MlaD family protein n=1 Tax=Nocardioides convexus TaxID=2712224 RepID=UPI002418524A|nr:MlaD family protein [Nocardioides convexus]NHA00070.1 MCE family protein [Nocardioides convexus]
MLVNIVSQGDALTAVLRERRQAISRLVRGTADLSAQVAKILSVNQAKLGPMLRNLEKISQALATENETLGRAIPAMAQAQHEHRPGDGDRPLRRHRGARRADPRRGHPAVHRRRLPEEERPARGVPAVSARLRRAAVVTLVAVVLVGAAVVGVKVLTGSDTYRVTATFTEMPGVYPGNAVKILGVRVGRVVRVDPGAKGVEVELEIDDAHRLPTDVSAFLMAPNAVNDRFIELAPAYSGAGSRVPDGGRIAPDHTVVPQSVDQIIDSLDEFSRLLGPQGANADGSLSRVLASLADTLGGQGSTVHQTRRQPGHDARRGRQGRRRRHRRAQRPRRPDHGGRLGQRHLPPAGREPRRGQRRAGRGRAAGDRGADQPAGPAVGA